MKISNSVRHQFFKVSYILKGVSSVLCDYVNNANHECFDCLCDLPSLLLSQFCKSTFCLIAEEAKVAVLLAGSKSTSTKMESLMLAGQKLA